MEYKVFFLLGLMTICSCTSVPVLLNNPLNEKKDVAPVEPETDKKVLVPVLELAKNKVGVPELLEKPVVKLGEESLRAPLASPPVKPREYIKLYVQDGPAGIYRNENGDYVRVFKVLNYPTAGNLAGLPPPVPEALVTSPTLQRLVPLPFVPQLGVQQRSAAMMNPIMARNGKTGTPTARYSLYDNFGPYDNVYYNQGMYGNGINSPYGWGSGYPYNQYQYQYSYNTPY